MSASLDDEILERHAETAEEVLPEEIGLYVNGEFTDAADGETFETRDPTTGEVLAEVPAGKAEDVDRAVDAASEAFATAPDRETVRDFVESEVDTEATHAASYLSTITAVPDPERRATRYLTAGVHTALQLRDIAEGLSDPDAAALRAAIPETPPGASALADAVEDADGLARQLGTALLAERTSVADDGLPVNHIGLTL